MLQVFRVWLGQPGDIVRGLLFGKPAPRKASNAQQLQGRGLHAGLCLYPKIKSAMPTKFKIANTIVDSKYTYKMSIMSLMIFR
jgi:hypothetical protein